MKNIIDKILLDVCLDERIQNGVVNFNDENHLMVLAENLFEYGLEPQEVAEVITNITLRDGKYPDRQAFNKEGWLVTFPSPAYKMAAIKKGTHFETDPTHGKGGMNLYYKRRGKQARKKQQAVSAVEPEKIEKDPLPQVKPITPPETPETPPPPPPQTAQPAPTPPAAEKDTTLPHSDDTDAAEEKPEPSTKPVSTKPLVKEPSTDDDDDVEEFEKDLPPEEGFDMPENFVELTKKFAAQKNWKPNETDEWYDETGTTVAVTAIDGEVVPVEYNDRQELRSFISSNE
jgi:hypothetical protein